MRSSSLSSTEQKTSHPVVVVGIAGGSGSGKSTLAARLGAAIGADRCLLLSFDDYYRDLAHLPPAERAQTNFDHPDSLDEDLLGDHLDSLRAGDPVRIPVYDFATHSRTEEWTDAPARPVVVVDGILLLAVDAVAERLDLAVFVDASEDVRLARRIARDGVERGRSEASVRAQFAATVGPMHDCFVDPSAARAHLRVSGEHDFGPAVRDIAQRVERLAQRVTTT